MSDDLPLGYGAHRVNEAEPSRLIETNGIVCPPSRDGGPIFDPKPHRAKKRPALRPEPRDDIIGSSAQISKVRELISLYAPEPDPVLICGETGVGKEAVARQLHLQSPRKAAPFVVRNVGRVDRDLAGADFFGHARGAFTGAMERRAGLFEQAHGGSLHLDEIAELPFDLQANLLRVIEDGVVTPLGPSTPLTVDVRTIAATNGDLEQASMNGAFRKDLYYRLAGLRIDLPPLRARGEDSIEIAEYYLHRISAERGASFTLAREAREAIGAYHWPGNVRELRNSLRLAAIHVRKGTIKAKDLPFSVCSEKPTLPDLPTASDLLARYLTAEALRQEGGVVLAAAQRLQMNREKCGAIRNQIAKTGADPARLRDEFRRLLGF